MPKILLAQDPAVIALLDKKLGQANKAAAADAMRMYKGITRTIKESLTTMNLDKKVAKAVSSHVLDAISQHAPGASEAQAAE